MVIPRCPYCDRSPGSASAWRTVDDEDVKGSPLDLEESQQMFHKVPPGKPVACNYGLLSLNNGLLWGIVAVYFGLLGCGLVSPNNGLLWGIVACCFGLLGFPAIFKQPRRCKTPHSQRSQVPRVLHSQRTCRCDPAEIRGVSSEMTFLLEAPRWQVYELTAYRPLTNVQAHTQRLHVTAWYIHGP